MFGKKYFLTALLVVSTALPALAYQQSDVDQLLATREGICGEPICGTRI